MMELQFTWPRGVVKDHLLADEDVESLVRKIEVTGVLVCNLISMPESRPRDLAKEYSFETSLTGHRL